MEICITFRTNNSKILLEAVWVRDGCLTVAICISTQHHVGLARNRIEFRKFLFSFNLILTKFRKVFFCKFHWEKNGHILLLSYWRLEKGYFYNKNAANKTFTHKMSIYKHTDKKMAYSTSSLSLLSELSPSTYLSLFCVEWCELSAMGIVTCPYAHC